MRILSIDACGNEEGLFEWNAWYHVGNIDKQEFERIEREEGFLKWYVDNGYVYDKYPLEIYDDGHNIVIQDKETGWPLFAIEYGNEY